jgi:hypothetical protein
MLEIEEIDGRVELPTDATYWLTLDYSRMSEYDVTLIVNAKNASPQIIQQIIKTARPDYAIEKACRHELAQIEDILEWINKVSEKPRPATIYLCNDIIRNLFKLKRKELNTYLQTTYNIDTQSMTNMQIQEMLNMQYPRSVSSHTS